MKTAVRIIIPIWIAAAGIAWQPGHANATLSTCQKCPEAVVHAAVRVRPFDIIPCKGCPG